MRWPRPRASCWDSWVVTLRVVSAMGLRTLASDDFAPVTLSYRDTAEKETQTMGMTFPGESAEYRAARDRLLEQETQLRRAIEAVAAARRALPPGGAVAEDYVFQEAGPDGAPADVRLSELFAPGKDTLVIYSMMYPRAPDEDLPCPSCTQFLDSFDGVVEHAGQRINVAIVAKAPVDRLVAHA